MEIILSKHCTNFSGSINKSYGYSVCRRGKRFFSVRNANRHVPAEGHIRFILSCAEIAQMALHITDINIRAYELWQALIEAGQYFIATELEHKYEVASPSQTLNAKQVLDFAEEHKLEEVLKRKKSAVTFAQLTKRLERAIHADVGERGLNILLYGWICKYGKMTRPVLNLRKHRGGEYWLTAGEAEHFSNYAGYDLTKE